MSWKLDISNMEKAKILWWNFLRTLCFQFNSSIFSMNLSAGEIVNEILEGEMFRMTLSRPNNGNAQHLRVVSAVPLRTGFRPAIESLREYFRSQQGSWIITFLFLDCHMDLLLYSPVFQLVFIFTYFIRKFVLALWNLYCYKYKTWDIFVLILKALRIYYFVCEIAH